MCRGRVTSRPLHRAARLRARDTQSVRSVPLQGSHLFLQPVRDHGRNLEVVLFVHQEMAVAVDTDVGQADEVVFDTGLLEREARAMRARRLEGGLGGHDQDRDIFEMRSLRAGCFCIQRRIRHGPYGSWTMSSPLSPPAANRPGASG